MANYVLSLSGGLDSTALLYHIIAEHWNTHLVRGDKKEPLCIHTYGFCYGSRHQGFERAAAQRTIDFITQKTGWVDELTYGTIDLTGCFKGSGSSLVASSGAEIPEGHYAEESMKSTVVENRNAIFASILFGKALSWANTLGECVDVCFGVHGGDHAIYPDCRPEAFRALQDAFQISNWDGELVRFRCPFINIDKPKVLWYFLKAIYGLEADVNQVDILKNTHTCYNPDSQGRACGKCGSCIERLESFAVNNAIDPIDYQ
jgi:7-cyano-7-deazaguanine synthase